MRLMPVDFHKEQVFGVELDCISEVAATGVAMDNGFTAVHAAPPTITAPDFFGGRWVFTHTAVGNQLMVAASTNEIFQFVQDRPIRFVCDLLPGLTAATPEQLNIFVGCMDAIATNPMQDAGAGPKATGDQFGFFTPETGGAVFSTPDIWYCVSQHNGTEIITELTAANRNNISGVAQGIIDGSGDGIARRFIGEYVPTNAVPGVAGAAVTIFDAQFRFWIDSVLVATHTHKGLEQITIGNTTLMNFGLTCQNTAAASIMNLDYLKCEQLQSIPVGA